MNKKAAMEMSIGTIVTIVLLMGVLVLGGVLIQKIYFGATENVNNIDTAVKSEISKLFSQDSSKKIVIYPASRKISIEKGEDGQGFAFSIRNIEEEEGKFTYEIKAAESDCPNSISVEEADEFISLGKTGEITIPAGSIMEEPKLVTFNIPDTAAPCSISYSINLKKDGKAYGSSIDVILNIQSD